EDEADTADECRFGLTGRDHLHRGLCTLATNTNVETQIDFVERGVLDVRAERVEARIGPGLDGKERSYEQAVVRDEIYTGRKVTRDIGRGGADEEAANYGLEGPYRQHQRPIDDRTGIRRRRFAHLLGFGLRAGRRSFRRRRGFDRRDGRRDGGWLGR